MSDVLANSFYEQPREAVYNSGPGNRLCNQIHQVSKTSFQLTGFMTFDYYLISLGLNFSHLFIGVIVIYTLWSYSGSEK